MNLMTRTVRFAIMAGLSLGVGRLVSATEIGVCEHVTKRGTLNGGGAYEIMNGVYRMCRNAGINYVRSDFEWNVCEPAAGQWDWTTYDRVVAAAEAEGVTILPIICYDSWVHGKAADHLDLWKEFVTRVVTRYKSHFKAVEVWNEENHQPFWIGTPNVQEYIPLLKVTYETVKAIDPNIQVVMGGLAGRRSDYFKTLCTDAKDYFDIVAFHPYNNNHEPSWTQNAWDDFLGKDYTPGSNGMIDEYLKVMSDTGVSKKPVWITEIGYATHASGVSEANQAKYLKEVIAHCESKGIDRVYIYEFRAPEWQDQPDNAEGYFGMLHADMTLKPAFETVAKKLKGDGWTNPYAGCVFLAAADEGAESSVTGTGHWSNQQAPSSANDYLVDIGRAYSMMTPADGSVSFGGRSLTLGRIGGGAGALSIRSPALNVADLRLANGDISFAGGNDAASRRVLSGTKTVSSTSSDPFSFVSEEAGAFGQVSGTVKGAAGTCIRFATEAPGASLDVVCDFNGGAYYGSIVVEGPDTTVRFTTDALEQQGAFLSNGIILRNGARLAPVASGEVLECSTRGITGEGGVEIYVAAGETMTLEVPLYGTFTKTGGGRLTLSCTGTGKVNLAEGALDVTPSGLACVGAVTGGTLLRNGVPYDPQTGLNPFGTDTFEAFSVGTSSLAGWTGDGVVVAGQPTVNDPPGFPVRNASHTKTLLCEDSVRTYEFASATGNQTLDYLVKVEYPEVDSFKDTPITGREQFSLTVDGGGFLWLLHADEQGAAVWSRLDGLGCHQEGEWLRLSAYIDYKSVAGAAFVQIRENGSVCTSSDGFISPSELRSPGSWFRCLPAAGTNKCVSRLRFKGDGEIDDLVLTGTPSAATDAFDFGNVTAVGGIPLSWFDGYGIPRDPNGDPDGDGFANRDEWKRGTDPLDRRSHPLRPCVIVIR